MSRHPIPPSGPVTDWLRTEALDPYEPGRQGEYPPMFWLAEHLKGNPPDADRINAAVEELLGEGDAKVSFNLLSAANAGPPSIRQAVARAIGAYATTLATLQVSSGRTLLADAVEALRSLITAKNPPAIPAATVDALDAITRREEGWPTSVLLGLVVDASRFAPRLVPTLQQLSDAEAQSFVLGLVSSTEPNLPDLIDRIATEAADDLKQRVAAVVKSSLQQLADARATMWKLGVAPPNRDPPDVEWGRYAARLGVTP